MSSIFLFRERNCRKFSLSNIRKSFPRQTFFFPFSGQKVTSRKQSDVMRRIERNEENRLMKSIRVARRHVTGPRPIPICQSLFTHDHCILVSIITISRCKRLVPQLLQPACVSLRGARARVITPCGDKSSHRRGCMNGCDTYKRQLSIPK